MIRVKSIYPLDKKSLKNQYGYLSFQTPLINVDVVGIRIVKSWEVVVITFRGAKKTGFIYEGNVLTEKQLFRVFSDVPEDINDLEKWEEAMGGKIDLLYPINHQYVFINEKEVAPLPVKK